MANSLGSQRKNFRCVFNPYVTKDNREGIIRSIISQFEGYEAEPMVTAHEDGFILTLTLGPELTPTVARDKILWNQFVESVTAQDAIRKIQILRLPQAGIMDFGERATGAGSVGAFAPDVDPFTGNTGVDEKLNIPLDRIPKYQIDADPGDSLGHHASVRYADPTDLNSEDQAFVHGLTPADLTSDVNRIETKNFDPLEAGQDLHRPLPAVLGSFKRIAIDTDAGSAFTLNKPNGFQSVGDPPDQGPLHEKASPGTGIGGGAPISGASWYVTQPGNEQGTEMGVERNRDYDLGSSSAPFAGITASTNDNLYQNTVTERNTLFEGPAEQQMTEAIKNEYGASTGEDQYKDSIRTLISSVLNDDEENKDQGIKAEYGSTLDMLGVGEHPMGGATYGSFFGINETYDYEGDIDVYDI